MPSDAAACPARAGSLDHPRPAPPCGEPVALMPGLWWLRLRLPLRLDHVNAWLIEEEDGTLTVIDTGFDDAETRAVWRRVLEGPFRHRPLRRVIATHYHPDHIGLAGWLCGITGAELWAARSEWLMARMLALDTSAEFDRAYERYDRRAGLPEELIRARRAAGNLWRTRAGPPPGHHRRLRHGDLLAVGPFTFRVIVGEGHAPEMVTLVDEAAGLLIAADQILPRISPVVSVPPSMPEADVLADFLASLDRYRPLAPDLLVLPSHGRPFRGLHRRLDELAAHHEARLARALAACDRPRTVYEVMPALFDFAIDRSQLGFALGETYAHLQHLWRRGELDRELGSDGALRFRRRDRTGD